MRRPVAAVVDEAEALAFEILEIERRPAVALADLLLRHAEGDEPLPPPGKRAGSGHAQARAHDAARAAPLAADRPVEKGQVGARRRETVGVEQMVGADIVLVDGLLDETHAERLRIEAVVLRCLRGNGREMMDAGEMHESGSSLREGGPLPASR